MALNRKNAHRAYMRSEHWKVLSEEAKKRDQFRCRRCDSPNRLEVHHLVYRTPIESGVLDDVVTLCHRCHRKEHGLFDYDRPFEIMDRELDKRIRYLTFETRRLYPDWDELFKFLLLAETPEDERRVGDLIRGMMFYRMTHRQWATWLKNDREVKIRHWRWSEIKLMELKKRKEELNVWEALRQHV